jgi:hypothetical protein
LRASHKYGLVASHEDYAGTSGRAFRSVKARAAQAGISLKEYVAAALREKLEQASERTGETLRMKHFGSLAHLREETRRIERIIEQEFETIDPDAWKLGLPLSPDNKGQQG